MEPVFHRVICIHTVDQNVCPAGAHAINRHLSGLPLESNEGELLGVGATPCSRTAALNRLRPFTFLSFPDFLLGLLAGSVTGGGNATLRYNAFPVTERCDSPGHRIALSRDPFFSLRGRWSLDRVMNRPG